MPFSFCVKWATIPQQTLMNDRNNSMIRKLSLKDINDTEPFNTTSEIIAGNPHEDLVSETFRLNF